MSDGIITFEQLAEYTGYDDQLRVRKWLDDNGIKEFRVPGKRGRICTTVKALNAALGVDSLHNIGDREIEV